MDDIAIAHWNESCNGGGERVAWELARQFDAPLFVGRRDPSIEPEDVDVRQRRAIHAWRQTDCERMIVHFMQPHQPFRSRPEWEGVFSNLENLVRDVNQGGADIWKRCRDGDIEREELWAAYCDNLRWVWESVESELLRNVDGDVTVTADHGNGMGEWGCWSHAGGQLTPEIRKVPVWRATGRDDETVAGEAPPARETDTATDEQLAALGYTG